MLSTKDELIAKASHNTVFAKAGHDKLFSAVARYQSLVMGVTVQ